MFIQDDLEKKIEKQELLTRELDIFNESLNQQTKELFIELGLTTEQLTSFMGNPTNFTGDNWNEIQRQKQMHEERLQREISNVPDPRKTKKKLESQRAGQNWIFVR